jgi:hypothetical protein
VKDPVQPPELLLVHRAAEDLGVEFGHRPAEDAPVLVGVDATSPHGGEGGVGRRDHQGQVVEQGAVPVPDKMRSRHG